MDRKQLKNITGFCFTVLFSLGLLAVDGSSQTNRTRPRPTPTPVRVPPGTEPAVISRADDYPTVVLEPVPANSAPATSDATIEELRERLLQLEEKTSKKDPDQKQRQLALNLDILTKSEQRSDSLRKQLFEMIEKENSIRGRIDQIDNDLRPEAIERSMATVGSLRPEELREQRRRSLTLEKTNLQTLLAAVQKNRSDLEQNLQRSEALVEKLRVRIEKEIDDALSEDPAPENKPMD